MTPEKRDKYLRKTYGITLDQYNTLLNAQGGGCGVCGSAPRGTLPLVVDHVHYRVHAQRTGIPDPDKKWQAGAHLGYVIVLAYGPTKDTAIKTVRTKANPRSVRGLLCPGRHGKVPAACNRNLGRVDDSKWLRAAADYLDNPPARKVLAF